jgi:hypothetical protein
LHGMPVKTVSIRVPSFTSNFELTKLARLTLDLCSFQNSQSDGQSGRVNQSVEGGNGLGTFLCQNTNTHDISGGFLVLKLCTIIICNIFSCMLLLCRLRRHATPCIARTHFVARVQVRDWFCKRLNFCFMHQLNWVYVGVHVYARCVPLSFNVWRFGRPCSYNRNSAILSLPSSLCCAILRIPATVCTVVWES